MAKRRSYTLVLVNITVKGYDAFKAGLLLTANPYQDGYRNNQGPGGNLQRVRREHWVKGWKAAEREQKEATGLM